MERRPPLFKNCDHPFRVSDPNSGHNADASPKKRIRNHAGRGTNDGSAFLVVKVRQDTVDRMIDNGCARQDRHVRLFQSRARFSFRSEEFHFVGS